VNNVWELDQFPSSSEEWNGAYFAASSVSDVDHYVIIVKLPGYISDIYAAIILRGI
jgi:hypothetical protein